MRVKAYWPIGIQRETQGDRYLPWVDSSKSPGDLSAGSGDPDQLFPRSKIFTIFIYKTVRFSPKNEMITCSAAGQRSKRQLLAGWLSP